MKKVQYSRRQFTSELLGGAICIGLSPVLFAQQTLSFRERNRLV